MLTIQESAAQFQPREDRKVNFAPATVKKVMFDNINVTPDMPQTQGKKLMYESIIGSTARCKRKFGPMSSNFKSAKRTRYETATSHLAGHKKQLQFTQSVKRARSSTLQAVKSDIAPIEWTLEPINASPAVAPKTQEAEAEQADFGPEGTPERALGGTWEQGCDADLTLLNAIDIDELKALRPNPLPRLDYLGSPITKEGHEFDDSLPCSEASSSSASSLSLSPIHCESPVSCSSLDLSPIASFNSSDDPLAITFSALEDTASVCSSSCSASEAGDQQPPRPRPSSEYLCELPTVLELPSEACLPAEPIQGSE